MLRSVVVFPQPLGPTTVTNSPSTETEIPSTATVFSELLSKVVNIEK